MIGGESILSRSNLAPPEFYPGQKNGAKEKKSIAQHEAVYHTKYIILPLGLFFTNFPA